MPSESRRGPMTARPDAFARRTRAVGRYTLSLAFASAASLALGACSSDARPAGCASGGATSAEKSACASASEGVDPTLVIDNMESQSSSLPMLAGRSGSWWAAGDGTPGASYQPAATLLPERLLEPRCDSRHAMRFSGQGFNEWGALIGLSFAYAAMPNGEYGAVAYDAHLHTGVTFWARIGDTSTNLVSLSLQGRMAEPVPRPCQNPEPAGDGCSDGFSAPLIGLDTTWRRFELPFTGLAQHHPQVVGTLDPAGLYALTFGFPPATVFDFWVDDLSFF